MRFESRLTNTGILSPIGHETRILGTLGTWTNIAGTFPRQKSLGQLNSKRWDNLGLRTHVTFDFPGHVSHGIFSPKGNFLQADSISAV